MLRATWKSLLGHKLRFLLTGLAIALGVGLVSGSYMFTDSLGQAFDDLFSSTLAGFDVQVRPVIDTDLDFAQGEPLPASLVEEVEAVPGVVAAQGSLFGFAQVVIDGEAVVTGGPPTFVVSWPELIPEFGIRSGTRPVGTGEAALDPSTAARYQVEIGDTIELIGVGEPRQFTVTGTAGIEGFDSFGGAVSAYVPLSSAQELLGLSDQILTVEVTGEDSANIDRLITDIEAVLPAGAEAVPAQTAAQEQLATFKDALGFLNTFLLVFAGVTVFVAAFLIQNTFRIIVAQRTRELALLRAVGASRRQVTRMVMGEAVVIGLLASVLGLGMGVVLARLIRQLLSFGGSLPSAPFALQGRTVLVAVGTGLAITLISAVLPARAASRVPPVTALQQIDAPVAVGSMRRRAMLGSAVLTLGLGLLAAGLLWERADQTIPDIAVVGAGAALIFIGIAVLAAVIARPVTAAVGAPLRRSGVPGRLAVGNAGRSPRRTAATASALMVGLTLVSLVLILAESLDATARRLLDERFRADLVIAPAGFGGSRLSPEIAARVGNLPEVALAVPVRGGQVEVEGDTRFLMGGNPAHLTEVIDFTVTAGSVTDIGPGTIGMRAGVADDLGVGISETVEVTFARTGRQRFEVAAIYEARGLGAGLLVDLDTFTANFTEQFDDQVFISLTDGTSLDQGRAAIEQALEPFAGAQTLDQSEFEEQASDQINSLVRLVFGLLGVAVVIAVVGITNTLTLSVHERTREIGLVRAVGLSRRQLRSSITWESVMIALLGGLLGLALGLFFGWALIAALEDDFLRLSIPWSRLVLALLAAALAGVLAAAVPAWRAARRNILEAIAYE
ncbi:MAG TPA: FtsX-like permease family protein [Acidimicrobiia bacterium]|nr:FtsX-like permease family protein [Acidimicrobiia bacterium]